MQRGELHQIFTVSPPQQILCSSMQNHWKIAPFNMSHWPFNMFHQPFNMFHQSLNMFHQPFNMSHQLFNMFHQPFNMLHQSSSWHPKFCSLTVFHNYAQKCEFSVVFIILYSFSSLYCMTYNSYFFEYSSFCSFEIFWRVRKCYSILSCHCWKLHLGSETIPSATLSPKLWLILVISNYFLFYAKRVCYQHKWKAIGH